MSRDEELLSSIKKHLRFLETKHDFSLRKDQPGLYYLESERCEIQVLLEYNRKLHIAIAPFGKTRDDILKNSVRPGRIEIKIVSTCVNSRYSFEDTPWDTISDIDKELAHYSKLIKRYCKKMVRGIFSQWPMIRECIKKR
ncbi:MAG: hypothetical protein HN390_03395 [Anaerolineae bacterium]|jgi:hypothetical protein|nr:hypothetical protein [Anaerolineae bacterium]MBT7990474.1 hypothetical protein [Anaerolineae bacterium]